MGRTGVAKIHFGPRRTSGASFVKIGLGPPTVLRPSYVQSLLNHHKNLFQVSIGPTIHSTGIKACLTYNPPGPNYPGYQRDRTVSNLILKLYFGILCQCIELD